LYELLPDGNNTIPYATTLYWIGRIKGDKNNYDEAIKLH
jgi:hypothetical protein